MCHNSVLIAVPSSFSESHNKRHQRIPLERDSGGGGVANISFVTHQDANVDANPDINMDSACNRIESALKTAPLPRSPPPPWVVGLTLSSTGGLLKESENFINFFHSEQR